MYANAGSDRFLFSKKGDLKLKTGKFTKAGYYYADLVCSEIGGSELRFAYQINMKKTANSVTTVVNTSPKFVTAISK